MIKFNILEWLYEYWVPVKGYEGYYEVSNWGRVKSLNYLHKGISRIIVPVNIGNGYYRVSLCKNGVVKNIFIHRIVAEAFVSNPDNLPIINHKSEKTNENFVWNLEWCTNKYNSNYGTIKERILNTRTVNNSYGSEMPVIATNANGDSFKFKSLCEAARQLKLHQSLITDCLKGRRKTTGGFTFKKA